MHLVTAGRQVLVASEPSIARPQEVSIPKCMADILGGRRLFLSPDDGTEEFLVTMVWSMWTDIG